MDVYIKCIQLTKLIRVSEKTYDRLAKHGDLKDSFDSVLNKVLDVFEEKKRR